MAIKDLWYKFEKSPKLKPRHLISLLQSLQTDFSSKETHKNGDGKRHVDQLEILNTFHQKMKIQISNSSNALWMGTALSPFPSTQLQTPIEIMWQLHISGRNIKISKTQVWAPYCSSPRLLNNFQHEEITQDGWSQKTSWTTWVSEHFSQKKRKTRILILLMLGWWVSIALSPFPSPQLETPIEIMWKSRIHDRNIKISKTQVCTFFVFCKLCGQTWVSSSYMNFDILGVEQYMEQFSQTKQNSKKNVLIT